nr:ABC transporter permease [Pseudokineococcus marinus]
MRRRAAPVALEDVLELAETDPPPPPRRRRWRGRPWRRGDGFDLRDLLAEGVASVGARPGRLALTMLGTVLGIASLVVTVGLAQTAAGQVGRQFDAVAATQVVVRPGSVLTQSGEERATGRLPWDAEERVERLAGVEDAGALAAVDLGGAPVTAVPVNDPSAPAAVSPPVLAASPGLLDAVRGRVVTGRFFDAGHDARADQVVVLGARAAERLGVGRVDRQPTVFLGEAPYTVIGVVDDVRRRTDLLDAVLVPLGTARADLGLTAPEELQVRIAVGAGPLVARQAPVALDPGSDDAFDVEAPPERSRAREAVQADLNATFLALGAVALLVGGLGIANVTLLSVLERRGEIGLRRAVGATRRQVAGQFLVESVVLGLLGGVVGASLGVLVVVGVSVVQAWTPVLDLPTAFGSALLGGLIGLVAGAYPAVKAATVEPITALRGGV